MNKGFPNKTNLGFMPITKALTKNQIRKKQKIENTHQITRYL